MPDSITMGEELDISYNIRFRLNDTTGSGEGTSVVSVVNNSDVDLNELFFFLYPNIYSRKSNPYIQSNYPDGFQKGEMALVSVIGDDGLEYDFDFVPFKGKQNIVVSIPLPEPVKTGERRVFTVTYHVKFPEKLGTFSLIKKMYTVQAGWYPYLPGYKGGEWVFGAVPLPALFDVVFELSSELELVGTGEVVSSTVNEELKEIHLRAESRRFFSFAAGHFKQFKQKYQNTQINLYLLENNKSKASYLISLVKNVLDFYQDRYGDINTKKIVISEGYLSDELFALGDGLLIVNYRLRDVFFLLENYHSQRFARGVLEYLWWESGLNEKWVNEGLSSIDANDMFAALGRSYPSIEKFIKPFSFLPVVDNMLYSDALPMKSVYFGRESIKAPREDFFYFNNIRQSGVSVFRRISLFFGNERFYGFYKDYAWLRKSEGADKDPLSAVVNFERLVNSTMRGDVSWYYNQWLFENPPIDYRITDVEIKQKEGSYHATIGLMKSEYLFEPVDLEVTLTDRTRLRRQWKSRSRTARIELDTSRPISRIELDPDNLTDDKDRYNNSIPPKWKFLLEKLSTKYDFQTNRLEYMLSVSFQPVYRNMDIFRLELFNTEESSGGVVNYTYIYNTIFLPGVKQSISPSLSLERNKLGHTVQSETLDGLFGLTHTVGTLRFPLYPDIVQRLIEGIFPYSSLTTEYTQRLTGQNHPYSLRFMADIRSYMPVFKRHSLAFKAFIGQMMGTDKDRLFFLGGTQGIRGYTKLAFSGRNIMIVSLEYRFPIATVVEKYAPAIGLLHSFHGALFVDTGTVSNEGHNIFKAREFKRDIGIGISCNIDIWGFYPALLRFDTALPVSVELEQEKKPHFYLTLGNPF